MNLFNFKIAKALGLHADEVIVSVFGCNFGEVVGQATTPRGVYDFTYNAGDKVFTYMELAK